MKTHVKDDDDEDKCKPLQLLVPVLVLHLLLFLTGLTYPGEEIIKKRVKCWQKWERNSGANYYGNLGLTKAHHQLYDYARACVCVCVCLPSQMKFNFA